MGQRQTPNLGDFLQEISMPPEASDWGTWIFFMLATGKSWVTISSIEKARKLGWTRMYSTYDAWTDTFRLLENAGILPRARLPQ